MNLEIWEQMFLVSSRSSSVMVDRYSQSLLHITNINIFIDCSSDDGVDNYDEVEGKGDRQWKYNDDDDDRARMDVVVFLQEQDTC